MGCPVIHWSEISNIQEAPWRWKTSGSEGRNKQMRDSSSMYAVALASLDRRRRRFRQAGVVVLCRGLKPSWPMGPFTSHLSEARDERAEERNALANGTFSRGFCFSDFWFSSSSVCLGASLARFIQRVSCRKAAETTLDARKTLNSRREAFTTSHSRASADSDSTHH
jgi:hypothetical protein